jgi:hypothetical protein
MPISILGLFGEDGLLFRLAQIAEPPSGSGTNHLLLRFGQGDVAVLVLEVPLGASDESICPLGPGKPPRKDAWEMIPGQTFSA